MKIALLSPKGPLYRHRGGIFGKSLRYAPLAAGCRVSLPPRYRGLHALRRYANGQERCIQNGIHSHDAFRWQGGLTGGRPPDLRRRGTG